MENRRRWPLTAGTGNWSGFVWDPDLIQSAAADWAALTEGIQKPWLCWNVSPSWSLVQQRMVASAGWTPLVGFDPRVEPPPTVPSAVVIDFNRVLGLPLLWPHFVIEFAFMFVPRLAFWHADLLVRPDVFAGVVRVFDTLEDGALAAVKDIGGRRNILRPRHHRYWELLGCTTRGASSAMFETGTGWWRHFAEHPNCLSEAEKRRRRKYNWDSGSGVMYWKRYHGGRVVDIPLRPLVEGHCTSIHLPGYVRLAPDNETRNMSAELDLNYSLPDVASRLGLAGFLQPEEARRES